MVHITWGVIVACGKTEQLPGGADIALLSPGDNPIISYSLVAFERSPEIDGFVIVAPKPKLEMVAMIVRLYGCEKARRVVAGTGQRYGSLLNALKALDDDVTMVSIHDVSRPCLTADLVTETVRGAKRYGAAVAAVRIENAVKEVDKGQKITKSLDRSKLWATQTPQTFRRELLEKGLEAANKQKLQPDDEAEAVALVHSEVHLVPSSPNNMKVRSADDLMLAASLLRVK